MTNEDPLAPARGVVNGCAIGALLWAAILGAAWLLLGGGGGCGSPPAPVQVPLYCNNNVYHWGSRTGITESLAHTQVTEDCEWDGLDGEPGPFGPDNDTLDSRDPHAFWDYRITTEGAWDTTNFVWTHDLAEEAQAWTWSGSSGVAFDGTAGVGYHVEVESSRSWCVNEETRYHYTLRCPGAASVSYYSWATAAPPYITPVVDGPCQLDVFSSAFRQGIGPTVPLEECWARDVFRVYR
jgi:hypothetical protein